MNRNILLVIFTFLLLNTVLFAQNTIDYSFFITDPCSQTTYEFNGNQFFEGDSFIVEEQNLSELSTALGMYQPLYDGLEGSIFSIEDGALDNNITIAIWLIQLGCNENSIQDPLGRGEPHFMFWGVVVLEEGNPDPYDFEEFYYFQNGKKAFLKIPRSTNFQSLIDGLQIPYSDLAFAYYQGDAVTQEGISWESGADSTTLFLEHFSKFGGGKGTIHETTGIDLEDFLPLDYELYQNYPNPFNPSTIIRYSIPKAGVVSLKVFNSLGEEIKTLVSGLKVPGNYDVEFNSENLASGIYYYQLSVNGFNQTKKMIVLK